MIQGKLIRDGMIDGTTVTIDDFAEVVMAGGAEWAWFDVVDPTAGDLHALQQHLGLHPLAIEDARHRGQAPKVEIFGDHIFIVLRPLSVAADDDLHETEVHAFISGRYLLTLRFTPVFDLEPVLDRCRRQPDMAFHGTAFATYALLDAVTDGYLEVVEHLEDVADRLEDQAFGDGLEVADAEMQTELLRLRRGVVRLRRRATPMRQGIDLLDPSHSPRRSSHRTSGTSWTICCAWPRWSTPSGT